MKKKKENLQNWKPVERYYITGLSEGETKPLEYSPLWKRIKWKKLKWSND